jgi:GxxExxY protein
MCVVRGRSSSTGFANKLEGVSMLKENEVAKTIVDVAYHIHRQLGPGLLESVYHAITKYELEKRGLRVLTKEPVPIVWEEVRLELGFQADLIVEDVVVVEFKSVEQLARVHKKQLLTYLRLTNCRLGLLINFGEEFIRDGISRVVNGLPSDG